MRLVPLALALAVKVPATAMPYAYRMVVTPEEGPVDPAVEARYSSAFAACQQASRITADNVRCYADEFPRQDTALNQVWPAALARVGAVRQAALRAAQRRWIAARDPFCDRLAGEFAQGSIMPVVLASCRVELTIRRTMWLEGLRR